MKLRCSLLMIALVLLTGSIASAATADSSGPPAVRTAVAPVAAPFTPAAPSCGEGVSKALLPGASLFQPRTSFELCGACSVAACRGAEIGTGACSRTNPTAKCYDSDGPHCSADGLARCLCGNGPP